MHVNIHFLLLDSPMGTCSSFFSTVRLWRGLICFTQCQQKYHTTFRINMLKINKNITRDTTRSKLEMKGIGCTNEAIERKGWWQCNLFQFISGRFSSDTAWLEPNEYLSSLMLKGTVMTLLPTSNKGLYSRADISTQESSVTWQCLCWQTGLPLWHDITLPVPARVSAPVLASSVHCKDSFGRFVALKSTGR